MSNGGNTAMGGSGIDEPDTTTHHEINPTIYEELKLGSEGAGFKKLVP